MHCPTTLVVNDKETKYPLPEPALPLNFTNSTGLRYEAEEVRQCLLKGMSYPPSLLPPPTPQKKKWMWFVFKELKLRDRGK